MTSTISSMYDVNSTDVRIVLTADDMVLFDETVTNPKLLSMAGYYGAVSCGESVRVEIGSVGNKINVATLVRDQENWTTQTGTAPVFEDQSLSITSGSGAYELAAYTGEKFSGKVFSFKYKQTMPDSDPEKWGGFYFNLNDATTQTWGDKGVLVVIKPEAVELQRYGDQSGILKTANGEIFRSDMVYDVTFGVYDVNSTDVRIVMTVDGSTLFDETITDSTLHGASGYFGAIACPGGIQVTLNDLSGNDDHYNKTEPLPLDGIIADTANWKDFSWAGFNTKPVFGEGTVSVTGTTDGYVLAGYAAEKYRNTEFRFKYQQTVDDAANNWGGFIYSFSGDVTNLAWNSGGVMVSFEKNKTTLYAYGDAAHSPLVTTDKYLENGTTHDISFSVCQTGAKELRVILTVDEEVWFNALYTDAKLANTAGYFCVAAVNKASATIQATGEGGVIDPPAENYTLRTVNDLLADPCGWTLADWAVLPTFGEGSITASGASNYSLGGTKATFKDTVFKFKYQQTRFADDSWAGFYLNFAPDNVYWNVGGVSIDFNQSSAVLHCFGKNKVAVLETSEPLSLENGREYEITFGVYTVDEETVKVLLTVDGTTVFEKEIKSADLVNAELHFGIISRDASATISSVPAA